MSQSQAPKLAYIKRLPTKKELRESREFYESIGPLRKHREGDLATKTEESNGQA